MRLVSLAKLTRKETIQIPAPLPYVTINNGDECEKSGRLV
jgi:hypothetical protein